MSVAFATGRAAQFEAQFKERAPSPQGQAISIRGLTKRFGALEVLRGVDLDIPAGQFIAIIGRSGCGKSTLLRILAGLDEATSGEIVLTEGDSAATPRIMFQEPRLLPWARTLANVEVGLGAARKDAGAELRVLETLRAVGLADKANEWPSVLSGGQKQRVALARALVSRPRLLVFDEPLGALDALTRIEMQTLLERVWRSQQFTAVLVTHDVSEALMLADRIVMIDEGRVALDVQIDLKRPRRRGAAELARLEGQILGKLIREEAIQPDYII
ncbi:ATP-binding cassette domain-containing protein [Terrarubrum flagellatum]|uniref:ATP-binding cassette domain-containing protein n=1 Tax=Terrirubrum flagellatum TaxID=2895980 RepID=UPI003144ED05